VYVPVAPAWRQLGADVDDLDEVERAAVKESGRTVHHRDGSTSTKFTVESVDHTQETYAQWIQRQVHDDPDFARQVLGKTRYELLKRGKITLDRMVVDGRIRRLTELI